MYTRSGSSEHHKGRPQRFSAGSSGLKLSRFQATLSTDPAETLSPLEQERFGGVNTSLSCSGGSKCAKLSIGLGARKLVQLLLVTCPGGSPVEPSAGSTDASSRTTPTGAGNTRVTVFGGFEPMALRATTEFEQDRIVLWFDARSTQCGAFPTALPCVSNIYSRGPPEPLFQMRNETTDLVKSARAVPRFNSAGGHDTLRSFHGVPPMKKAKIITFIEDNVMAFPRESDGRGGKYEMVPFDSETTVQNSPVSPLIVASRRSYSRRALISTPLGWISATHCGGPGLRQGFRTVALLAIDSGDGGCSGQPPGSLRASRHETGPHAAHATAVHRPTSCRGVRRLVGVDLAPR